MKNTIVRTVIDTVLVILLIYVVVVQFDDSDAMRWVILYGILAIAIATRYLIPDSTKTFKALSILYGFIGLAMIGYVWKWIQGGMPNFVNYTPVNAVIAEHIREFGGIVICFVISRYYLHLEKINS